MPNIGVVKVAVIDHQCLDHARVQIVGVPVTGAVIPEFRTRDRDGDIWIGVRQDSFLVSSKYTATNSQVACVAADTRAVIVGHGGTAKAKPVHHRIGVGVEDRLAIGRRHGRDQRHRSTHRLQGDTRGNVRETVDVGPGLNLNNIAVLRGAGGGDSGVILAGAYDWCRHVI